MVKANRPPKFQLVSNRLPALSFSAFSLTTLIMINFIALTALTALPAVAKETGLAGALHSLRMERGKLCMASHFHHGVGSAATPRQAFIKAAVNWQNFTKMEYGEDWARLRLAAEKTRRCRETLLGWTCSIKARPCRVK